jgi:hypothetical protein
MSRLDALMEEYSRKQRMGYTEHQTSDLRREIELELERDYYRSLGPIPSEQFQQYLDYAKTTKRPTQTGSTYTKTPIKPPPENVLLQYIGGPKNGEQEYLNWVLNDHIQNLGTHQVSLDNGWSVVPVAGFLNPKTDYTALVAIYRLTFVPMEQTPFSDAQIVIAIFQE